MGWLAPLFLAAGAVALSIPLLVHLIHRERAETIAFPSLMFLQRIPYRSMRRQKIRHWLLFLLRCAGVLLLAAAFARPFFDRGGTIAGALGGARELVVLLDRSYSMGYGEHWPQALAAARRALDGVSPGDHATVILFAEHAQAANRTTDDPAALRAAVDTARPGSGTTRYAPAFKLARQLLEASELPFREVVLITDFQRTGWNGDDTPRLPPGTEYRQVNVADADPSNVSVAGVSFQRDYPESREQVRVSARLANKGPAPVRRLPVALELGGRELQRQTLDLEPNSSGTMTFTPFMLPDGVSRGTVRAGADRLAADNAFHFVLRPGQGVSVLVLEPPQAPGERSLFLRRALGVGDHPSFRLDLRRGTQLGRADLAGRSIVISNDAGLPGGESARRLAEFVAGGGGVIVALGERAGLAAFPEAVRAVLPGRVGVVVDRPGSAAGRLAQLDYSHPLFEPFSAPRSGDFTSARFFRYRRVDPDSGAAVLARFDDGSPALLERRIGQGTVLLWASTLDNFWTDLPVQPIYVPFLHQLARRASGYTEAQPWFTVGQAVDIADRRILGAGDAVPTDPSADLVAVAPSGSRVVVPAGPSRVIALPEQGFYEVRRPGERPGQGRVVAANLDLSESDLTMLDPEEFAGAVRSRAGAVVAGAGGQPLTPEDRERRQAVWWYLLVVAFLLFATETAVSNWLSRERAVT